MATEGTFGQHVSDALITQIKARGNIISKEHKTPKEITYINENVPWIVLRSGVDYPELGNIDDASKFVLVGGTAAHGGSVTKSTTKSVQYADSEAQVRAETTGKTYAGDVEEVTSDSYALAGSSYGPRAGLKGIHGKDGAYVNWSAMGYRPMPGITKISVKAKDSFGMLTEATVNLVVWSREDLESIDRLYFKPGMTALLEWGHSVWVDNSGEIKTANLQNTILPDDLFFTPHEFSEIEEAVQDNRKKFDGNYEALFGFVVNFSYSFNKNGSYSCTIKLVSKGVVLEGLQIPTSKQTSKNAEDEDSDEITSEFHRFFREMTAVDKDITGGILKYTSELSEFNNKPIPFLKSPCYSGFLFWKKNNSCYWITLGTFLKLVEALGALMNNSKSKIPEFECIPGHHFVSTKEHFSLNPYVSLVLHRPTLQQAISNTYTCNTVNGTVVDISEICPPKGKSETLTESECKDLYFPDTKEYNDILNILISVPYILGAVNASIDSQTSSFSLMDVVSTILANIQKAFGNINSFKLVSNQVTGKFAVVDLNDIESVENTESLPGKIPISGLKTIVRDLRINSEVSSDIANEMSIAAAAPNGYAVGANPSLVYWNEGCVNRHWQAPASQSITDGSSTEVTTIPEFGIQIIKDPLEKFLVKSHEAYQKMREDGFTAEQANQAYSEIHLEGEDVFRRLVQRDNLLFRNSSSNVKDKSYLQKGIIPIKVEMTMQGIAGLVVGTSFMIDPGLVPSKYNNWGYIVIGVESNVEASSGWTTTLSTQYFPVYDSSQKTMSDSELHIDAPKMKTPSNTADSTERPCIWSFRYFSRSNNHNITYDPATFITDQLWELSHTSHKNCSGGAYACARLFSADRSTWSTLMPKYPILPAGSKLNPKYRFPTFGTVSAKDDTYFTMLKSLGYTQTISEDGLTTAEIKTRFAGLNRTSVFGDVVSYWATSGDTSHYHSCFRGKFNWISDFIQNNMFVYHKAK